jgi:formyltetrahydrofolate deformylase
MSVKKDTAIILAHCPDQKGIVASITDFLLNNNGNIVRLDQHVDRDIGHFFIRVEWELADFQIPQEKTEDFFQTLIADKFNMQWKITFCDCKPRVGIMVSKYAHCFYDILSRYDAGEWDIEIPLIISNHEKFADVAKRHDIPFFHVPKNKTTRAEKEAEEIKLMKDHNVDLIILARYMQILTGNIISNFPNQIINIHHSSLPAFVGADPYRSAYKRGVKFMGATAHYVTEELDAGPIIIQDVIPITHRDSIADMKRKGKDIEKIVLADAIWAHINHRVLIHENKTVVF